MGCNCGNKRIIDEKQLEAIKRSVEEAIKQKAGRIEPVHKPANTK